MVKPPQISNADWKESSMDTALKQGTISSQPLPTSVLGSTDKLVGFVCEISVDLFCWNSEPLASIAELTSVTYTLSFPADDYLKIHKDYYLCILPILFCTYHITINISFSTSIVRILSCSCAYLVSPFSPFASPNNFSHLSIFLIQILVTIFPWRGLSLFFSALFFSEKSHKRSH